MGKADFLVFRAMNQHGFLGQLQEKKLVSVPNIDFFSYFENLVILMVKRGLNWILSSPFQI